MERAALRRRGGRGCIVGERRGRPRVGVVSGAIRTALTYSCTRTVFLRILDGHLMLHVDSIGVMELGWYGEGSGATPG